jgi:hypothetical protein
VFAVVVVVSESVVLDGSWLPGMVVGSGALVSDPVAAVVEVVGSTVVDVVTFGFTAARLRRIVRLLLGKTPSSGNHLKLT